MTCRRCQKSISAYIDRELRADEMRDMQSHLERCAACQREYQSLLDTKRLLSGLAAKMPREELEARILARVDAAAQGGRSVRQPVVLHPLMLRRRLAMVGTALMGACAALVILAIQPQGVEPPGPASLSHWQGKPVAVEPAMPVQDILFLHEPWQRYQASPRAMPVSSVQDRASLRDEGSTDGRLTPSSAIGR